MSEMLTIDRVLHRLSELERRVTLLESTKVNVVECVCPPLTEKDCRVTFCPRRKS